MLVRKGPSGISSRMPSSTVQSAFRKNRLAPEDIASLDDFNEEAASTVTLKGCSKKWPCPVCVTVPFGSKKHHIRTRHPECPLHLFQVEKLTTVAFSKDVPAHQSGFQCPWCQMHIPYLASQDRKRAKQQHLAESHPDFKGGLTGLHALARKGKPQRTKGVSNSSKAAHAKRRQADFSSHAIVEVPMEAHSALGQRGTARYQTRWGRREHVLS